MNKHPDGERVIDKAAQALGRVLGTLLVIALAIAIVGASLAMPVAIWKWVLGV